MYFYLKLQNLSFSIVYICIFFPRPMSNLIVIFLLVLCMCVCCKRCCKRRINKQQTNPLGPVINHNERIVLIVPNSQNNSNIPNEPGTTQFLSNTGIYLKIMN